MLGKVGNHRCIQQQTCHRLIGGQPACDIVSEETRNRSGTDQALRGKGNWKRCGRRWEMSDFSTELMGR